MSFFSFKMKDIYKIAKESHDFFDIIILLTNLAIILSLFQMVFLAKIVVNCVWTIVQLFPFMMSLINNGQSLILRKYLFIIGNGIGFFSIKDLDILEPIHHCSELLFGKLAQIIDLSIKYATLFLWASYASTIRIFQSTSP